MPVIVSCPECEKKLRVPDNLIGKKVKCPGCQGMFTASADAGDEDEPAQKPAAKSANKGGVVRDEDVDDKPKRKSVVPPPVKDSYEDEESHKKRRPSRDEDDEDDRPRGRRGRDDDDDEDDRPRSRRRGRDDDDDDDDDAASRRRRQRDEDDDEDDGDTPSSTEARRGWQKVRTGVMLVATYILIMIGWTILSICARFVIGIGGVASAGSARTPGAAAGAMAGMGTGFMVLTVVDLLVRLLGDGLRGTGHGLCLASLARRGSMIKGLAIATFALFILYVLGNYGAVLAATVSVGFLASGGGGNPLTFLSGAFGVMLILSAIGGLANLAGYIVFPFYLRSVAYNVKDHGLYKQLTTFIICECILIGLSVLIGLLAVGIVGAAIFGSLGSGTPRGAQTGAAAAGMAMCGFGIYFILAGLASLALLVWFIVILFQVRGAVDRHIRRI
jgi:hypothetical protein